MILTTNSLYVLVLWSIGTYYIYSWAKTMLGNDITLRLLFFFPATLWTKYCGLLFCFPHDQFMGLICFLVYMLNLILLCSRYWKSPSCVVVFTENFSFTLTWITIVLTLVGDKHAMATAVVSFEIWMGTSQLWLSVLSDFFPWRQMRFCLLDRFSTHFNLFFFSF